MRKSREYCPSEGGSEQAGKRAKVVKSAPKAKPAELKKLICSGERRRGGGASLWADGSENVAAKADMADDLCHTRNEMLAAIREGCVAARAARGTDAGMLLGFEVEI